MQCLFEGGVYLIDICVQFAILLNRPLEIDGFVFIKNEKRSVFLRLVNNKPFHSFLFSQLSTWPS